MKTINTDFLKFLAITLIINSHLDKYYPNMYWATGGAIGNSLFFILSSFGLYLSEKKKPQIFANYYFKRIKRLFPSIYVAFILLLFPILLIYNKIEIKNILDYLGFFFYPPFWFIKALYLYYAIGFVFIKNYRRKKVLIGLMISFLVYLILYFFYIDLNVFAVETYPINLVYYFMIFLLGIIISRNYTKIKYNGFFDLIILLSFFSLFYFQKLLLINNQYIKLQGLQHVLLFGFVFYMIKINKSDFIQNKIMTTKYLSFIISFIGSMTLELYVAHSILHNHLFEFWELYNLKFPLNIIVFLALNIAIAYLIKIISDKIRIRYLNKLQIIKNET